jgi:long-chain acyl-CoA synthetase
MRDSNGTGGDTPPLQKFYGWERERGDDVFLTQPDGHGSVRDITWSEAGDEVRRMAAWLQSQGWPDASKVAILGKNSAHWVLADLAITMAGLVSVPIYPTFNAEAVRYILLHSEARACFVGKLDSVACIPGEMPPEMRLIALPLAPALPALSWQALVSGTAPLQGEPVPDAGQLWTIVYTSGTTGTPKGVMLTHGALAWAVTSIMKRDSFGPRDRVLSYLPLAHIMERTFGEQAAIAAGIHLFFAESLDTFVQDLQRARPTLFISVPRLWVKFQQGVHAKLPPEKLDRLLRLPIIGWLVRRKILKGLGLDQCRLAGSGAAPLPPDVLRWFRNLGLNLIEGYAMTENCAVSHTTRSGTSYPGTVGFPYAGLESRVDAATGEIQMRSPAVMTGYYKDPSQTASAFTGDGWLRTGDKGRLDEDGCLRITGRVKDIFKTSKGKYVAPAPIESVLARHPAIEACIVSGASLAQPLAIALLSAEAAAGAESPEGRAKLTESLNRHLGSVNDALEPHERIACLALVTTPWTPENGFVTPTLKVKRARIEEVYGGRFQEWVDRRQPVVWTGG